MRLTKNLKEQIINNWYVDKQKERTVELKNDLIKNLRGLAESQLNENIEIVKKHESIIDYLGTYTTVAVYVNNDILTTRELNSPYILNIDCQKYASKSRYNCVSFNSYSEDDVGIRLKEIIKNYNIEVEKLNEETQIVNNILISVTTVKKLVDLLPDIEKYIPDTNKLSTQLINPSDLTKAKSLM